MQLFGRFLRLWRLWRLWGLGLLLASFCLIPLLAIIFWIRAFLFGATESKLDLRRYKAMI